MLAGDIGSSAVVTKAATKSAVQNTEESVEIPEEYISLNDSEQEVVEEDINSEALVETEGKKIPILRPSEGKEQSVKEEVINSDGSQQQEEALPTQILIAKGLEEFDSVVPEVNEEAGNTHDITVTSDVPTVAVTVVPMTPVATKVPMTPTPTPIKPIPTPIITYSELNVGDVFHANGEEDINQWHYNNYTVTPEVSGYYSLVQKEFSQGDIEIYVYGQGMTMGRTEYWYSHEATAKYINNYTCYMEAGETYIWQIGYCFYDTLGKCSAEFVQTEALEAVDNKLTGTVTELAGFTYNNENAGILKIDFDSSKGYTYYMNLNGTVIKLVKDEPAYIFLSDIGEWDCSIWKNSQDEDEVELSLELVEENVMPKTGGIINAKTTSYKQDNSCVREEMLVSFVPENSGYYAFHNELNSGLNLSAVIYEEYAGEDGSGLAWKASTYGSTSSNIVELEAGKKYYYYISNYIYEENYELLGEVAVCIEAVEEQGLCVGTETQTTVSVAALCGFQTKAGTFYEITIDAEEGNELELIIPDNVQSLGFWSWCDIKNTNTFKIYTGTEGECLLKFLKKNDFSVPASVSVKVSEYEVPGIEEETVVTNETQMDEQDSIIRKFVPVEDGTYSFWAVNYNDTDKKIMVLNVDEGGYLNQICDAWYYDETDVQVDLTEGTAYYVQIVDGCKDGENISPETYMMGVEKSTEGIIVLEEGNAESESQLGMYKSANITVQVPKAGFYDITVTGEAESYKLDYEDSKYVLYSGIGKEFYFSEAGEYSLRVFREIRKDSEKDQITISVKDSENVMELFEYTDETENKVAVNLEESNDFQWIQFTPQETTSYLLTSNEQIYLELYASEEDDEEGSYLSEISTNRYSTYNYEYMCYFTDMLLEEGKTYYIKAYTWENGAQGNIRLIKNVQVEAEISQEVSVETQYGTVIQYQVPENGIYQISVTGTKKVYNIYKSDESLKCDNGAVQTMYLPQGEHKMVIVPQGKKESGNKYKKEQITVKMNQIPTEDITKEITMNKSECWVKYEPEETGTYYIGIGETDSDLNVTVYTQGADECLWYEDTLYSDVDEVGGSYEMEKGYAYYFMIRSYEVPNSFVMYATKDTIAQGITGQSQQYDFSKHIRIDLEGMTEGFYQVKVNGESQKYLLSLTQSKNHPYYEALENAESRLMYVDQWMVEDEEILYLHLNKPGTPSQENVEVSIEKLDQDKEVLLLNTKMKKQSASSIDFYSFTPEQSGYYSMKLEGIDTIEYDSLYTWYDGSYLEAGQKYTFFVRNCEGMSYSITPVKSHEMVVYDQREYQAFIASGGTITLQDTTNFTEEMWEALWEEDNYTYVDSDKILVTSVKGFKNKSDIWYLRSAARVTVYEPVKNYVDVDKQLQEYGNAYTHHLKGYIYQNLCDENGNIISPDSKVKDEYIAWANYVPKYVPVYGIQIKGVNVLNVGETSKLTAVLDTGCDYPPTDATVKWSSSNPGVVSVDSQGNIKANKLGKATITCTANDKNHKSATLNITVSEGAVYVSKVIVSGAKEVNVGETIQLKAVLDTNGKGKPSRDGVTWSSNNTKVAKVDKNGNVTGLSKGSVVITAASNDGKAKADYTITVKEIESKITIKIEAKKVTLNESKITIKKGTTYKWLEASIEPKNTTDQSLKWSSSNTKVATVTGNGKIKAKGVGKATITVTTSNGKKDKVQVTVTKNDIKTKNIKLSKKETLYVGGTISLSPEFTPVNTTNKKVKWGSSNEKVATVSKSGVVTAKKEGKTTITVTSLDGTKKKAKCVVTVKKLPQVKGLKLSSSKKGTVQLTWKEVKEADGYQILMATSQKGEYKKIGTTKAGTTEFTKKKLSGGKKYYFKVVAYQKNKGKQYQGKKSTIKNIKVK